MIKGVTFAFILSFDVLFLFFCARYLIDYQEFLRASLTPLGVTHLIMP